MTDIKKEVLLLNPKRIKEINNIFSKLTEDQQRIHAQLLVREFKTTRHLFFLYYTIIDYGSILHKKELHQIANSSGEQMKLLRELLVQKYIPNSTEKEMAMQEKLGIKSGLTSDERKKYLKSEFMYEYMALIRKLLVVKINKNTIDKLSDVEITKSLQKELVGIYKITNEGWNGYKDYLINPKLGLKSIEQLRLCIKDRIPDSVLKEWATYNGDEIRNKRFEYLRRINND